ncbi:MAG: SDR family NAD(P)-dependent oxidoreductase [Phycisphaerales bacterium]
MIDLSGKPIAITGASSGIGAATALACARAGMPVAISARRRDRLDAVATRIRAECPGARVFVQECDVAVPGECEGFVDAAAREFGGLYAVYANAGYGVEAPIHEMTDRQMRDIFETNFFGTLATVRPALAHMMKSSGVPRGHVLICSSCVAKMPLPWYGAYSATKAAQNHISRAMRLELEPQGIHVSSVHPIGTRTEFFDQVKGRTGVSKLVEHTPDRLLQSADFVAGVTVRCLRRPVPEVWTGAKGHFVRFGMSVTTFLPRVGDFFIRGMVNKRLKG